MSQIVTPTFQYSIRHLRRRENRACKMARPAKVPATKSYDLSSIP